MKVKLFEPLESLNAAYRKEKVTRAAIDRLKRELPKLAKRTANTAESEENHKGHFMDFLREVWYREADCLVATKDRIDAVIHDGPGGKDPVGVMMEMKRSANRTEMFSKDRPNVKSLHELVLYFMRERDGGNTAVKNLLITDGNEVYLFADREFERLFWEKRKFRKDLLALDADRGKNNALVYEAIERHVSGMTEETLGCTFFTFLIYQPACEDGDPDTDERLLELYKILSPVHLLRRPFAGDSNHLDKCFYRELLHLIGLHEVAKNSKGETVKSGGKKVIERLPEGERHAASLLENTIQVADMMDHFAKVPDFHGYGADREERRFAVALELCLTWVNRVLFLKLLETQLVSYHQGADRYRFLTRRQLPDYDALNTLFFAVLNRPVAERDRLMEEFAHVPYLSWSTCFGSWTPTISGARVAPASRKIISD